MIFIDRILSIDFIDRILSIDFIDRILSIDFIDRILSIDFIDRNLSIDFIDRILSIDFIDRILSIDFYWLIFIDWFYRLSVYWQPVFDSRYYIFIDIGILWFFYWKQIITHFNTYFINSSKITRKIVTIETITNN